MLQSFLQLFSLDLELTGHKSKFITAHGAKYLNNRTNIHIASVGTTAIVMSIN